VTFFSYIMGDINTLQEAVRQELWRGLGRLEAAAAAERERDEALYREVAVVRQEAAQAVSGMAVVAAVGGERAAADVHRELEGHIWAAASLALHYFGTARSMAALGLAAFAFGGQGSIVGRALALLLGLLLDAGVVMLVGLPRLGVRGRRWLGCLASCWDGGQRRRRGDVEAGGGDKEEEDGPAGGLASWALSWLWGPSPPPGGR